MVMHIVLGVYGAVFCHGICTWYYPVRIYRGMFFAFLLSTSAQAARGLCFTAHKLRTRYSINPLRHSMVPVGKYAQTCALLYSAVFMLYLCCTA